MLCVLLVKVQQLGKYSTGGVEVMEMTWVGNGGIVPGQKNSDCEFQKNKNEKLIKSIIRIQ